MRILFFGDVVGRAGRDAVLAHMPMLRERLDPDLTVVNGENSAGGCGVTVKIAEDFFAAGIDVVGGTTLANVLSMTLSGGAVAACGNVAGFELATSVAPFILRGVSLLGIESSHAAPERRLEAWARLARDIDRDKLAEATTTMPWSGIENAAHDIVAGKVRGRLVVEIG